MTKLRGQVIKAQSGYFTVRVDNEKFICEIRGRLKQGPRLGDVVSIGDWVLISDTGDNTGQIEEVEPRVRMLSRMAPRPQGEYQQILIANPDQAVFVFSSAEPSPKLRMLDRFLVIAEMHQIPALIVVNKIDIPGLEATREMFKTYEDIGYEVVYVSGDTGYGVEKLKERLVGRISVLMGPSGVGKSTLLNAIQPGLGLEIREVSRVTGKGKHTTVFRQLFPLTDGGYVADTPGLKALGLWDTEPEEVDGYFIEIKPFVENCQFSDCTHVHEPNCAVLSAVEDGLIDPNRYQSYLRLRLGESRLDL